MRLTGKVTKLFIPDRDQTASRDMIAKYKQSTFFHAVKKGKEYLDATHDYHLYRGDANTGRARTMTGREAKALNMAYELKFGKDKTASLYRWRWDKAKESPGQAQAL